MRTLLFDIDGTLLLTHNGGSNALRLALEQEFDLLAARIDVSFGGRTDRSLLAELLTINGLPDQDELRERLRRRYLSVFPEVLSQCGGEVMAGVRGLLDRLHGEPLARTCAMTGNLTETGEEKLRHFDLLKYVHWTSGGQFDEHRDDLARRTAKIIADRHGDTAADDVVVIGDTVADVRCGRVIGAKVIAVCTGSHDREKLEAEKPDVVLDDLSNTDAVLDLLLQ
ncbi:HAD family hydrolase [Planctomycetes bacterium K23_9]|uniref:phosphoglycolate phosphatase n=1 Tax=Stieleria marina TaxID=1930275 RepID=A0A517NQM5_9BACT|nr:Phosphoglycolate phosphatase [Planctomycetes bacterium K23_9]